MGTEKTWVIETADLEIGVTLSFDLTDSEGNILHKQGMPITDRLIERLRRKNIHSMVVKGASEHLSTSATQLLLDSFPNDAIEAITSAISNIECSLGHAMDSLRSNTQVDRESIAERLQAFTVELESNNAASLAVLSSKLSRLSVQQTNYQVERSTLLGLLGLSTSMALQLDLEDCIEIGWAGMLHDCSLLLHPEWFDEGGCLVNDPQLTSQYRNHPLESVEILSQSDSLSATLLDTVAQVHEQFDGSGFPHGLSWEDTGLGARILNLVDAYLCVVQPMATEAKRMESDAIAYLCHQAARNKFDPYVLRTMIGSLSMYPVGSIVELDDATQAVVVESNHERPMSPRIRTLDKASKTIDLGTSKRTIVGPAIERSEGGNRIPKSMMETVLWRSDVIPVEI